MHCSTDLRELFQEMVIDREITDWVIGKLWNCTDIMPNDTCSELQMSAGSNYAQAVRLLRREPF